MTCKNCGFDIPVGMKFCGMCGNQVAQACPVCAFNNPFSFRYCGMCGEALSDFLRDDELQRKKQALIARADESSVGMNPMPVQLEGERRVVTVIVADVTGSTNLLEHVGNEAWVELMNRVLLALEAEIYRFGGVVDQFRGDGLVAFFGSDISSVDDPERAILAGLSMLQAIERFDADLKVDGGLGIRLRVGVNTGEVIVASIGAATQHREDTAMGIAIAIAARLESSAEPGTVLASESTFQQCENQFEWLPLGQISVKGISHPLAVFRPTSSRTSADRMVTMDMFGINIPLVGRDTELHELIQHVELLKLGQGSIIFLRGDIGIGKQALVSETRQFYIRQDALIADAEGQDAPSQESIRWMFARSRSYNQNWPYSLWIDLFFSWLEVNSGHHQIDIRDRFKEQCQQLWGERYIEYYPYICEMLQLPLEDEFLDRPRYLGAEALRIRIFEGIVAWLVELSLARPIVLAFSELEHGDPSSLQLLLHCASLAETKKVMFMLLFRSDTECGMKKVQEEITRVVPEIAREVNLFALSNSDIIQLIHYLIGENTLPPETRQLLVRNSEGNPSYVVEILRSLMMKEILVQDHGQGNWMLSRPVTAQDLIGNLNRLVQSRVDRLEQQDQQVIQFASVIGGVFWFNVIQEMVGEKIPVKESLERLAKAHLIDRKSRNLELGREYVFHSDLIHDVVYESLLSSQRESLHLRVAKILEDLIQEDGGIEHQAIIAHHYRYARETRKELFYITWAAEKAREVFSEEEAFAHYDRALELLDLLEKAESTSERLEALYSQRFEVLNGRLSLIYQVGKEQYAEAEAKALIEIADKLSAQPTWMIDALLKQPQVVLGDTWDLLEDGLIMAGRALELARQAGDRYRELSASVAMARLLGIKGDLAGYSMSEQALGLAKELDDPGTQISILLGLSNSYGAEQPERCKDYLEEALALRDRIPDKHILLDLLAALGNDYEWEGNYYRLLDGYVSERLEISREIGDRLSEGFVLMYYAQIEGLSLGDYDAALNRVQEALRLTQRVTGSLYPMLRIAQLQVMLGNYSEAEATLQNAKPLSDQSVFQIARAGRWLVKAILLNERGADADLVDVLKLADQVRQLVTDQRVSRQYQIAAGCEAARAHMGLAQHCHDNAQRATHLQLALDETSKAVEVFEGYGFIQIIECTSEEILFRHAQALEANVRETEARTYYQKAYDEMMRKYDLIPPDSHFRRTYLDNIRVHRHIADAYQPELN